MIKRPLSPLISILLLAILAACSPQPPAGPVAQDTCPARFNSADFENHTTLRLDEAWIVGASSKWGKAAVNGSAEPVAEFHALHRENGAWRETFRRELPSSYNARVLVARNYRRDAPLVFFFSQQGAALENLAVYTVEAGTFKLVQHLEAGSFEWSFDEKQGNSKLVAIPWDNDEKPVLYAWDGQRFSAQANP